MNKDEILYIRREIKKALRYIEGGLYLKAEDILLNVYHTASICVGDDLELMNEIRNMENE